MRLTDTTVVFFSAQVIATIQTTENKKGTKQKVWRFSDVEEAKRFHNLVTTANTSGMKLLEIFVDMDHQAKGHITVFDLARAMKRIGMPVDEVEVRTMLMLGMTVATVATKSKVGSSSAGGGSARMMQMQGSTTSIHRILSYYDS